jgi:hypothetical protein
MSVRPAAFGRDLLDTLEASDERRRRRRRDTTPDAIGLGLKRELLARCVAAAGAVRATAREIFADWRLGRALSTFRAWPDAGGPSDDATRAV